MSHQATRVNEFEPNSIAKSAEVNEDFNVLYDAHNAHDAGTNDCHGLSTVDGDIVGSMAAQSISGKLYVVTGKTDDAVFSRGDPVYLNPADGKLYAATPTTAGIKDFQVLIHTGVAGVAAFGGEMDALNALSFVAPATVFLGATGLADVMPATGETIRMGKLSSDTSMIISIGEPE